MKPFAATCSARSWHLSCAKPWNRLPAARLKPEWGVLLRELDRLQEIETEQEGKHFVLRTPVTGDVGRVFRALGIALPPNIREADVAALID